MDENRYWDNDLSFINIIQKSYIVKNGHIIQKPFANYKDFAQCATENKDKGDPNAYCGAIKHKVEKRADFTSEDVKRIGDNLNIDWTKIDQNEFLIGLNIELEHGTKFPETNITDDDEIVTAKIVLAHINEFPDYYSKTVGLPKLEDELKKGIITKTKIYVEDPSSAPKGVKLEHGKRGGTFYESRNLPTPSDGHEENKVKSALESSWQKIQSSSKMNEVFKVLDELGTGKTSKKQAMEGGQYTPEQQDLHKRIIEEFIGKESIAQGQPEIIFVGGPPASGKSTLLKNLNIQLYKYSVINSDDIKARLPGYNGVNALLYHDEAHDIVDSILQKSRNEKRNIIIDSTLKNPDKEKKKMEAFKKMGYKIKVISINCPADISITRAADRFLKSGRYVPLHWIAQEGEKINQAQKEYQQYADEYELWDGSTFPPKKII